MAAKTSSSFPAPYLDVLMIHSRRLLHQTREEIAAADRGGQQPSPPYPSQEAASRPVDHELIASVRLLLEPVHLPDLAHTGLEVTPASCNNSSDSKPAGQQSVDEGVPLFYPTGAKSANMRELIRETLDKHQLLHADLSAAALPAAPASASLAASASAPAISLASASKSSAAAKRKARKAAAVYSPVRAAMSPAGALLDRELTRQAKDVVAALRANSSKINELIAK